MAVVIQEFEVRPAATPAPVATPAPAGNTAPSQPAPPAAELQRRLQATRERALRLYAH